MGNLIGPLLVLPSALCAVAPMLTALTLVWWLDRYDRKPLWLLGLTFLWGAIGGILVALTANTGLAILVDVLGFAPDNAEAIGAVIGAPLIEEPAKAAFLLIVLWNRGFDNMADGFVYGAAAGLGFGMMENFVYFTSVGMDGGLLSWIGTVVIRTFYSALMHGTATSIVGASLGFGRFKHPLVRIGSLCVGFPLAMGMHALWNGLITLDQGQQGAWAIADFVAFPLELLVVFAVFQLALFDESRTIRRELEGEVALGLIPKDHPAILASWWRRRRTDFVPTGVDHRRYVRAATSLALRKSHLRMAGVGAEFYRDEVVRLRRTLALLARRAATITS